MANEVTKPLVEGAKARMGRREIRLTVGQPRDPAYVFRRIYESSEAPRIVIDTRDKTGREVDALFQRFHDLIKANIWTAAALLKADHTERSIVFTNGCFVQFQYELGQGPQG